jgi:hypothetical protein
MKFFKLTILLFILIWVTQSCNYESENNKDVIPKDTMVMLISDIHIADATLNVIMNTEKFKEVDDYYTSVLSKYNVSRSRFDTSLAYYSSKPETFEQIYEDVMLLLSQKEGGILATPSESKTEVKTQLAYRNIATIKSNFDDKKSLNYFLDKKTDINSRSGKYSLFFANNKNLSNKLKYEINNISKIKLSLSFFITLPNNKSIKRPLLVIEVIENDKVVLSEKTDIYKCIAQKGDWDKIEINNSFKLKKLVKKGEINIFISNAFNQEFFIDDMHLKLDAN